jgi:hypothetical protein
MEINGDTALTFRAQAIGTLCLAPHMIQTLQSVYKTTRTHQEAGNFMHKHPERNSAAICYGYTNQPTNQPLNSVEQSPSREAPCHSACQEITRPLGNPPLISMLTSAQHRYPLWARRIHSTNPHPTSPRSTLIPSYHQCQGPSSGVPLSDTPK